MSGPADGTIAAAPVGTEAAGQAAPSDVAEIIVTGSRIGRQGANAPTPLTVVTTSELNNSAPSNLADALNTLPQFQGSNSQYSSVISNPTNVAAGNNLNLRYLGAVRALTLFDGQRLTPSSGSGLVDANVIPQLLVQRVDVVTGGASAAYGSDAVSGVVNFILDRKFEGLRAVAQAGISERGDNASQRLGIAGGITALDGRLHALFSAEYYNNDGIGSLLARDLGAARYSVVGANGGVGGTVANPYVTVAGAQSTGISFDGVFRNGPLANMRILADGRVVPFNNGNAVGTGVCTNCSGSYHQEVSLIPTLRTKQAFGRLDYDFSDAFQLHAQGVASKTSNDANTGYVFYRAGAASEFTIFNDNAFLSPAARTAFGNTASAGFARQNRDMPVSRNFSDVEYLNLWGGAQGGFGNGWHWDAGYSYGRSVQDIALEQLDNVKLRAAVDAVRDTSGNIVCRVSLTNPGLYPGCVPINLFGEGAPSQAAIAYVQGVSRVHVVNKLQTYTANLRGNLFEGWAGPISFAVGGEYRKQSLDQTTNSNPLTPPVTTGIRGFVGGQYSTSNVAFAQGSVEVKEGYAELLVPLLKDVPLARSLELNGAFRYTDYSTSGAVKTWKAGLTWEPVDGLRLRGTRSRDIRAPTLFELFAGQQAIATNLADPHTSASRTVFRVTGGNPDLVPETANTLTLGAVLQPRFVPGLTLTVDYYRIRIKDAIATAFTLSQIVQICEDSGGSDTLCSLINRPLPFSDRSPDNFPTSVAELAVNVASIKTSGLDVELGYRRPLGGGTISTRLYGTYLFGYDQLQAPGRPVFQFAGNSDINERFGGLSKLRGTATIGYDSGPFSVQVQERLIGKSKRSRITSFVDNDVPAVAYTDLNLAYRLPVLGGSTELFFNVQNLLDKDPPLIAQTANPGLVFPTYRTFFDVVGRTFTVGARAKF